jgi:hypothetical protein
MLHIIHLRERKDRAQLLYNELIEQNISHYRIWDGIIFEENPKVAIAKAHKQIVEWASRQNLPSVTIAEDDVKFTAKNAFDFFLNNEPNEFDLYPGGITYGTINPDNSVNDFAAAHLYKVNQHFYDTFLSLPEKDDIDRTLANRGKFIVCNPFVAIQHNGYSDNKKLNQDYDLYFKIRKLFR